jgi:signal transduction histidine kinase
MKQPQFLSSTSFRWALMLAGAFAAIVIGLFGFIYWQTADYLTMRTDRMLAVQLNAISVLSAQRRLEAIDDHLKQDSRGVQFAGVFGADGRKITGNLEHLPQGLAVDAIVQGARVMKVTSAGRKDQTIRAVARQLADGDVLVVGRQIDEAMELAHVVGQALALGLVPSLCLCLVAGALVSVRAQRRVEDVNARVQRIIAGDLSERLPQTKDGDQFSRLAVIVNGMLDEMENLIGALAGVGNDIAHDLRTPLTRARLALERGRANATTLQDLQTSADKAITNIDQSLTIITALLRLAEIENNRRSSGFGTVSLADLAREVADLYEPIADDKRIALKTDLPATTGGAPFEVHGDRDLLIEAVANLVDNAVKFTPEGGQVEIALSSDDRGSIIRIQDSGPGINAQECDAVLGLGLNLVAAIVKLHDFELTIVPGPGCVVEIACPHQRLVA